MKALLLGATGMVGQGVLRACLLDPEVTHVLALGRAASGKQHDKLTDLVVSDLTSLSAYREQLSGFDVCFYCLGISSAGMSEADYTRITYDLTVSIANALLPWNPKLTFVFISGGGTDGTEQGRVMWARIKGKAENAVLKLPFHAAYAVRPGFIQPQHGIVSRTRMYNLLYRFTAPLYPLWKLLIPKYVTTTDELATALLNIAKHGADKRVIENRHLSALAQK